MRPARPVLPPPVIVRHRNHPDRDVLVMSVTNFWKGLPRAWRNQYNSYRPHSALGGLTPDEYHRQRTTINQPALS
jgi:transposase InsO family protein